MIHAISLCHMEPATIAASLTQLHRTAGKYCPYMWLVDHHWPIQPENTSECLERMLGDECNGLADRLLRPKKNMGGTQGFNWAMREISSQMNECDSLFLWYDPDSWPVTYGWFDAMIEVMRADPTIATLSLWAPQEMQGRDDWKEDMIAGHKVRTFDRPEGFSVTMWRASFAYPEVKAEYEFYGQIESPAHEKAKRLGMRCAWLADFKEIACPIPHPKVYEDWKREHVARTFNGNFAEYYEAHKNG